jgi:predicted CXXCH cytochrome family protein
VAGDNLFRDFQVDLSPAATVRLHPADRHVIENVRDVVARGDERVTCLSCHDVHRPSTARHRRLARRELCSTCHDADGRRTTFRAEDLHSPTCRY